MKILVIEDEAALLHEVHAYLVQENYLVETAADFDEAMNKVSENEFDCVVVDINLPGGSGFKIIEELKLMESTSGIITISARDSLDDRLKGLNLGSDDYVTKPFHLSELNARIRSLLRRRFHNGKNTVSYQELTLDPEARCAWVHGKPLALTPREFDLLNYFIINKNRVLSQPALIQHLWPDAAGGSESYDFIYTHIRNLRRKLTQAGCTDYLRSLYGLGYKWTDQ